MNKRYFFNLLIVLLLIISLGASPVRAQTGQTGDPTQDQTGASVPMAPEGGGGGGSLGGYLYALLTDNATQNNSLYTYWVNTFTGELILLGSPLPTGGKGDGQPWNETLAYDAGRQRLYALNAGSGTITAYAISANGGLTTLPFSPISLPANPWWGSLAVAPSGSPLVVGRSPGEVASINLTATTATMAPGSPYTTGSAKPNTVSFSQDGATVYVGGIAGATMAAFSVNNTTGALASLAGSPFTVSDFTNQAGYATDASGRLFLSGTYSSSPVKYKASVATTSGGVPTWVSSTDISSTNMGFVGLLHPAGYYLAVDRDSSAIHVVKISGAAAATTLAEVSGSPFSTGGTFLSMLALNETGAFLFTGHTKSDNITTFKFDAGSGGLTKLTTAQVVTSGSGLLTGMAYTPLRQPPAGQGGFIYALKDSAGGNTLYGFRVNELNGELAPLAGFPVAAGVGDGSYLSERLAYDASNARLFVLNAGSKTVQIYSVDPASGGLSALFTPIDLSSAVGLTTLHVAPGGSPLTVSSVNNQLFSFAVSSTGVTPAPGSPYAITLLAISGEFSQDGAYFYTGQNGVYNAFGANPTNGELDPLTGGISSGLSGTVAFATDGSGRLFMTDFNSPNTARVYRTMSGIPGSPGSVPSNLTAPIQGLVHPAGFYMVADRTGQIGVYRVGGTGAAPTLTAVVGSPFASGGAFTDGLALNQSGAFLFATNGTDRNISSFSVDVSTGALSGVSLMPVNTLGSAGMITGLVYAQPPVKVPAGYVYILSGNGATPNQIYGYQAEYTSGRLSLLQGFPISTSGKNVSSIYNGQMAYDAANARVYALNPGANNVDIYQVGPGGALTPLPFSPIALGSGNWDCLAVNPAGTVMIAGNAASRVASYAISATAATPAPGSPYLTHDATSFDCAFSPDGAYAYVGGNSDVFMAGFSVNAASGALSVLPGVEYDVGNISQGYAMDDQQRLFTESWSDTKLRAFTLGHGIPSPVSGNPFYSGLSGPLEGLWSPAGYYLAVDYSSNQVGVYKISGTDAATTLAPVSGSPFATGGIKSKILAISQRGNNLFAANSTSLNVTSYLLDFSSGTLQGNSKLPTGALGSSGAYLSGMVYAPIPMDMSVTVTHSGSFAGGRSAAYNLVVTATADTGWTVTTQPVKVIDTLPAGMTFVSAAGYGWNCSAAGQVVTCTSSTPFVGGKDWKTPMSLTLNVAVDRGIMGTLVNTASLSLSEYDPDLSNNAASDPTVVHTLVFLPRLMR